MFSRLGAQPDLSPVCRVQQPPQIQTGRQLDRRNLGAWLVFRHLLLCLRKSLKDSRQRHVFASCLDFAVPRMRDARVWKCCTEASRSSDVPIIGSVWARVNSGIPLPKSLFCQPLQVGWETCEAPNTFSHAYVTQMTLCVFAWMYSRHSYIFLCILNVSTSQLLQLISFSVSLVPDAQTRQTTGRWLHT